MADKVGEIYYSVSLETGQMIAEQRRVRATLAETSGSLEAFAGKLNFAANAIVIYAAAMKALRIAQLADEFRLLAARVDIAAGSTAAGKSAFDALVKISRDTQTSLQGNIEVFNRLNQSILQMGGTQAQTLVTTDLLSKAVKVSGTNAVEAKVAMMQFGQALGSGKLQGDEFRSLMEAAPYLMKQLAAAMGVPIGQLKQLSTEGKLTSDVVVNALNKAADSINKDFAKVPQTIAGAMQVAEDAAGLAIAAFEKVGDANAPLIGIFKGVAKAFDLLRSQFEAMNTESNQLSRNDDIKTWSDRAVKAASYVVDAFEVVSRTFKVVGTLIAGLAGAASTLGTDGGLKQAKQILGEMVDDIEKIGSASFMGSKMREQAENAQDRRSNPAPMGKLRPGPADPKIAAAAAARRAQAKAYLDGLIADNKTALEKIDAEEQRALSENAARRARDAANADVYERAKVEIVRKFSHERSLLEERSAQQVAELNIAMTTDEVAKIEAIRAEAMRRADAAQKLGTQTPEEAQRTRVLAAFEAQQALADIAERNDRARAEARLATTRSHEQQIAQIRDEAVRQAEVAYQRGQMTFTEAEAAKVKAVQQAIDQQKALEADRQQTQITTLSIRAESGGEDAQIALIQAQAAAQLAALEEARQADLVAAQLYADQKVAIEQQMAQKITEIRAASAEAQLSMVASAAGQLYSMLQKAGKDQTALAKAAFLAERAIAVATIIMNTEVAAAKATGQLGIFGIPMATAIRATGYASAGIVAGMAIGEVVGGRQYGGAVGAGNLYRVNETGAPEMFVGSNGSQYMMPNTSGSVVPADQVSGDPIDVKVVVHNYAAGTAATADYDRDTRIVTMTVKAIAGQISNNSGEVWTAMRGATNIRSAL